MTTAANVSTENFDGMRWRLASAGYGIVSCGAISSSSMIAWAHYRVPVLRTRHHLKLALALVDAMAGMSMWFHVAVPWVGPHYFTRGECVRFEAPFVVQITVAPWITLAMALYRLIAFKHPVKYSWLMRRRPLIALYTWFLGYGTLVVLSTFLTGDHAGTVRICMVATALAGVPKVIASLLTMVSSFSVIPVNTLLYFELKRRRALAIATSSRDARLAQSIVIVCGVYATTWLAGLTGFLILSQLTTPERVMEKMYLHFGLLASVNCMLNYPIYVSRSKEYRQALGFQLGCFANKVQPSSAGPVSEPAPPRNAPRF